MKPTHVAFIQHQTINLASKQDNFFRCDLFTIESISSVARVVGISPNSVRSIEHTDLYFLLQSDT